MSDGYLILDDDDRVVQANPEATRILRGAVEDATTLLDGATGCDAGDLFDQVPYVEDGDGYEGEFVVDDDGERRYYSVETADLEDDGFVIGRLVILQDVTERVRARAKLRRERDELDTLFENISEPVAEVRFDEDDEPIVQRVNSAFEAVFGYPESRLRGESIDEFILPDGHAETADEMNARAVGDADAKAEVVRETTDGKREFLLQVAVPDEEGEDAFALYTDITDRKQRQRELERQNERLEEFASVISHDLRNPLNVAKEYMGVARRADDPEEFIEEAMTSLDRMEAMIDDVLTLAREGEDVAEPDTVDLDAVAEMAWNNCDTKDATLDVTGSMRFEADPDRLLELFENTFRNAVEHGSTSPPSQAQEDAVEHGGESITVTVGPLEDRRGFFVADDGVGIADHVVEAVFDHGVTTADDGTGFGMAIVDRIASAHGWSTVATESEDGGARFEFVVDEDQGR